MVIKVYTSGISGNKEVKKRQQRIMMILESKNIDFLAIDITEPGKEPDKQFMQDNSIAKDSKHPLPPQIFNEDDYCGDYEGFDLANENDELEIFLKMPLPPPPVLPPAPAPVLNGRTEHSVEKESSETPIIDRNEEIINEMIPNSVEELKKEIIPEESVHGYCYTPSLAKRLQRALNKKIKKPEPVVHGYCYTPSLAQRLAKALERSYLRKAKEEEKPTVNSDDAMDEDKEEADSSINEEEMENDEDKNGGGDEGVVEEEEEEEEE